MRSIKQRIWEFFLLLSLIFGCKPYNTEIKSFNEYVNLTYNELNQVLILKKNGLINYLNSIKDIAAKVKTDPVLISFFKAKNEYYQLKKEGVEMPVAFGISVNSLKEKINKHYLNNYLQFYDLLFINTKGDIFFTIRKESDYQRNIHDSLFINTSFTKKLLKTPGESFTDFQFYKASGMPSAFFIEPLIENGEQQGWILLQLSIDKINHMFVDNNKLGQTGEILLVNKQHYLLTSSRFFPDETILKKKLPDQNISFKFKERKGTKQVIDYRGKQVVSAFETFNFMNTEWLIITKKDKAELVSEYYMQNQKQLEQVLSRKVQIVETKHDVSPVNTPNKDHIKTVLIDDYKRVDTAAVLFTQGVSTCTSVSFVYPEKFAYMAHISPYDDIYNESRSDLMSTVINKIDYFEIADHQKSEIDIYITLTNTKTLNNILTKLLANNYQLNQIKVAYLSNADYANVYCSCNNKSWVNWQLSNNKVILQNFIDMSTLQELILN